MRNILARAIVGFFVLSFINQNGIAQNDTTSLTRRAPGITKPISYPENENIYTITPCDNPDVRIFPSARAQSEVHISINKQNPQVVLVSANTWPVFNSQQGAYWSVNGGLNWNGSDDLPNGAFGRNDPSTAFDAAGRGYVATLNADDLWGDGTGYLIQRTDNNGAVWQPQVNATGRIQGSDKEMIAADDVPTSPFANNLYCAWSVNPGANGTVQFNRSTNLGITFTAPITLRNGWGQGTNVQTGPNGEVYVCWADYTNGNYPEQGLGFVRSFDGGQNFTAFSVVFNYTGIRQSGGGNSNFGNTRVNSYPSMTVDKSHGAHRGRIYVVYAENNNSTSIIRLRFSDNQGTTWSGAQTISIPNGRQSWFPWISVDDTNGNIYVIYYSLDEATGFNTNTYVAMSNDGGATFVNQRVSDAAHVTGQILEYCCGYCGDYIGITSYGGRALASWHDNRGGGQWQIYVSEVRNMDLLGDNIVCTTSNPYTITNVPQGATVQWTASPQGIVTINSPNSPQTTITKNNSGNITLTATISNVCGGQQPIVLTKQQIRIGTYSTSEYHITQWPTPVCVNKNVQVGMPWYYYPPAPGTTYNWYWSSNLTYLSGQGTSVVTLKATSGTPTPWVMGRANNSCGTGPFQTFNLNISQYSCYSFDVAISPNPASNNLTVDFLDVDETAQDTSLVVPLQKVNSEGKTIIGLYDIYTGIMVKQWKYSESVNKYYNLNLSGIKKGVYVLQVDRDNQTKLTKVLIQ